MKKLTLFLALVVCLLWAPSVHSVGEGPWECLWGTDCSARNTPDEVYVNIEGQSDPFNMVMSRIVDRLVEDTAACAGAAQCAITPDSDTPRILKIVGSATVTYTDFEDMGDYRVGLLFCPSNGKLPANENYPLPSAGGNLDGDFLTTNYRSNFIIDFTEMSLTVDQTSADKRLVPIKFGCGYDVGWAATTGSTPGNYIEGLVVKGTPSIVFTSARERTNWQDGHIPTVHAGSGGNFTGVAAGANSTVTTAAAHGMLDGEYVTIVGAPNTYDGTWEISAVAPTTFDISVAFVATATGTWEPTHTSEHSSFAVWEDGLMRSDLSGFGPYIYGSLADDDNMGYVIGAPGWNVDRGPLTIEQFGVGVSINGNTVGTVVSGGNLEGNHIAMVIGNPYTADGLRPSTGTFSKGAAYQDYRYAPPSGFSISDMTIDYGGTAYFGGVQIYSGTAITFKDVHLETSVPLVGHMLSIGGGWTNDGTYFRPCTLDNDHETTVCTFPTSATQLIRSIRFIGGSFSADGYSDAFDAVSFGANFKANDYVNFATAMSLSDVDKTANGGAPACTDPEVDCRLFSVNTAARGVIDITGATTGSNNVLPFPYLNVRHDREWVLHAYPSDANSPDDDQIDFKNYLAVTTPSSNPNIIGATGVAGETIDDYWNVASFCGVTPINTTIDGCNLTVREGAYGQAPSHASFNDAGTENPLGGAAAVITLGDSGCGGAACDLKLAGDSLCVPVMSTITNDLSIVLRLNDYGGGDICDSGTFKGDFLLRFIPRLDR